MTIKPSDLLIARQAAEQIPGLAKRTAQRRIHEAVARKVAGHPEPGDELVQTVSGSRIHCAPLSWWQAEIKRRPLRPSGRPPEQPLSPRRRKRR